MEIFRTPFQQNIPQAFSYVDSKGDTQFAGAYAQTIRHFAQYQNYEFQFVAMQKLSISQVQKQIENGFYNISMHGMVFNSLFANISFSYPIEWVKVCIMVPSEIALPRYWYPLLPFGPYIWTMICISVVYVALLMTFLKHPSSNMARNLLSSMAVIIHSSNMNLKLVNASRRLQVFYILLLIFGFVLSNYYCIYLTVYCMKPIFQPFLNTEEELLRANRQILVSHHTLEEVRNNPNANLFKLEKLMIVKPQPEVTAYIQNFSLAFAYIVTFDDWIFMQNVQRKLIQPLYQMTSVCSLSTLNTFGIPNDAKFANKLNHFVLLVHQSGLWDFWQEEAFSAAIQSKKFIMPQDSYPIDPLDLNSYRLAWIVLLGGCMLSTICLMIEVVIYKRWCRAERRRSSSIVSLLHSEY